MIVALRALLVLLLLGLLTNPVRVTEIPNTTIPAGVFYLLDASESMAMGHGGATRWDKAVALINDSTRAASEHAAAQVSLFRFGRKLQAIGDPAALGLEFGQAGSAGVAFGKPEETGARGGEPPAGHRLTAGDPDTQLLVALRQISSRFGRQPPASIVVFSDGRARDENHVEEVAQRFRTLGVPIHVVPIGNAAKGGDILIVSVVAPASVRKESRVNVNVFLRSFGLDGQRTEVQLNAVDADGQF